MISPQERCISASEVPGVPAVAPSTNGSDGAGRPLRVIIVGAGIGGLTAAIGLRRNGHRVVLLEQSRLANETGAAVHLTPNANGILRRWGLRAECFGAISNDRIVEKTHDGRLLLDVDLRKANQRWAHPWHIVQRVDLHKALKEAATGPGGYGVPASLHSASKVVAVNAECGSVTLEDGSVTFGDVILGADGIYSTARSTVDTASLRHTGKAAFRFQISRRAAQEDVISRHLGEYENTFCTWLARDRRVVMYTCDGNKMLNFVCIHPDAEHCTEVREHWIKEASISQLLHCFRDFEPSLRALMSKADPSSLRIWQLLDMEQISWTSNKLALMGDAAHPFTPHQGQGAGMAIEDAAALSVVLSKGTSRETIPARLGLYEDIRKGRVHAVQQSSRRAGEDWEEGKSQLDNNDYNCGHDELDHSTRLFDKWRWSQRPNTVWQTPLGFGPQPGPLQDGYGQQRRIAIHSPMRDFTTISVRFMTSRTLLQNLFPHERFEFKRPNTVCTATWSVTSLNHVPWLARGGYTTLALFVHGVRYTKNDGTVVNGAFVPILFESLADAVVAGREQLGLPKVSCDVHISHCTGSCHATASWRGATFIDITLPDLREEEPRSEAGAVFGETNVLAYHYVPAIGEPGKADAEYACLISHADEGRVQTGGKLHYVARSIGSRVNCAALDWERLPTLHHIAAKLAQLPVYEIVSAKLVKGVVPADKPIAKRIE
ncbi:FAD binding domain-containing protein [Colletotrichum higginsianum]|uniref:FAD binding domain-containing protein n=1 Tax=Colletotrichum higginsianum (strain IMI 349063) TaxID=759273 RepID=H1VCY5_COLHI|nr:FAD binding domain-containing protein [Colletotrichum higginsianum]